MSDLVRSPGRLLLVVVQLLIFATLSPGLKTLASPADMTVDALAWLAGTWTGERDGVRTEEMWTAPAGEMILGLHRDVRVGRKAFFEYLRIEQTENGPVFMASPAGRPAKGFPLVEAGESHAVFADAEHDFPQKLTYRRDGDFLHVRAEGEGKEGRRVLEWTWELRDRCPGTVPAP